MQEMSSDNLVTLRDWVRWGASRFNEAGLVFGHGCDNALDEALALVLHAVYLDHRLPDDFLDCRISNSEASAVRSLFERRIRERVPAAYLIGKARFAGLEFEIDENVLIPRSPIAELIEEGFAPWLDPERVTSVLDLCCGSGCIGIACAFAFPHALVDLCDVSPSALEIASRNIERHHLEQRVRAVQSDVYAQLKGERYDLVVSNPPYVSSRDMEILPPEYRHEPALALEGGSDGTDIVGQILADAREHLRPDGIIVVEVGASAERLLARYPSVPFLWLDFERGGDGVFLLTAEQLDELADVFTEDLG